MKLKHYFWFSALYCTRTKTLRNPAQHGSHNKRNVFGNYKHNRKAKSALNTFSTDKFSLKNSTEPFKVRLTRLHNAENRESIIQSGGTFSSTSSFKLDRALEAVRSRKFSISRASTEFDVPARTLYGRCKREGIELNRCNLHATRWSEDAMIEALKIVR